MTEEPKPRKATFILAIGLIGIAGVVMTLISDFILIGRPNSSYSFFKLGTESMADFSQWRITVGTFLGIIVLPLQMAGLGTVYYGLRPAGKIKALLVILTNIHTLIMAVAFHISYAFIASGWKMYYEVGSSDVIAFKMLKRFDHYWRIVIVIMAIELAFASLCFIMFILKYKTLYPKWMALFSPICILLYIYPIVLVMPHPIGGFVAPAILNFGTMIFLILSTTTVYKSIIKR